MTGLKMNMFHRPIHQMVVSGHTKCRLYIITKYFREWRKRYRERFFGTREEVKEEQEEDVKDDGKTRSFETLFEEREGE